MFLSFSDSELRLLAALREARGEGREPALRLDRAAQASLLRRSLSRESRAPRAARRRAPARRKGLLVLWRRGACEARADQRFRAGACSGRRHRRSEASPPLRRSTRRAAQRIWAYFDRGGPENLARFLDYADALVGRGGIWREPVAVASAGRYEAARREGSERSARADRLLSLRLSERRHGAYSRARRRARRAGPFGRSGLCDEPERGRKRSSVARDVEELRARRHFEHDGFLRTRREGLRSRSRRCAGAAGGARHLDAGRRGSDRSAAPAARISR